MLSTTILLAGAAPATQPASLPPTATAPQPTVKSTVAPIPFRPYMPPARSPVDPRIAKSDGQHPLRARPALDIPPLAQSTGDVPAVPELASAPLIHVEAPDPAVLPIATIAAKPDTAAATFSTDATLTAAEASALILSPPPRTASPPAMLLSIPDPSRQPGAVSAPQFVEEGTVTSLEKPGPTALPSGK